MGYRKGSEMLLKLDTNGAGNFVTIGGIRGQTSTHKNPDVDVSNQGSPNKARELLPGASIKSMTVTGNGPVNDATPTQTLVQVYEQRLNRNWQIVIPGLFGAGTVGTYQGPYQITDLKFNGEHDKELRFDITLESAGDWTLV